MCWPLGVMTSPFVTMPLAVTVRQCRVCHKILSWPILDMADVMAVSYPHCGEPTDYIETKPYERQSVCCEGISE